MDALVTHPVPQAPAIPFKQAAPADHAAMSGGGAVLAVALLAIVVVLYLRKRLNLVRGAGKDGQRIRILETRALGPRTLLAVVEFGGREHLLAQTEHGVTRIADIEAEPRP
jgi:flagellar protein FliO/FliZ